MLHREIHGKLFQDALILFCRLMRNKWLIKYSKIEKRFLLTMSMDQENGVVFSLALSQPKKNIYKVKNITISKIIRDLINIKQKNMP